MTKKEKPAKLISLIMLILPSMLILVSGCSDLNQDYQPLGDPTLAYHPFGDVSEHGSYFAEEGYSFAQCTECHGTDLSGIVYDESREPVRSCYRCHTHENHDLLISGGFADADDHPDYLESHGWDIGFCFQCHVDISHDPESRVVFGGSCGTAECHSFEGVPVGPASCNTCHGNHDGSPIPESNWSPPGDLAGNTDHTAAGVGAHQTHLNVNTSTFAPISCGTCHQVPDEWDAPSHIDSQTPAMAEVTFSFPATANGAVPSWDHDGEACSSTWCHGENTMIWTETMNMSCTSCHGFPPPPPHIDESTCSNCHDFDGTTHVNGVINFIWDN